MDIFSLSRNWFDFCFENPEKISPIHTAIYFFCLEHCNRLGWKEKFGFPSQMAMEAIGVKNWRTYSKGLNDLVDFGFIKLIEKSKNQYSSNIIAIVKNTKATTKALDKALQKHSQKQGKSTVSIDIQETILQETINNNMNWRNDFNLFKTEITNEYLKLIRDIQFISELERLNPGIDGKLSLEKTYHYWNSDEGWQRKKKSKSKTLDWKHTFENTIQYNKVAKNTKQSSLFCPKYDENNPPNANF